MNIMKEIYEFIYEDSLNVEDWKKVYLTARRIKFESDQHVRLLTGDNREILFEIVESDAE